MSWRPSTPATQTITSTVNLETGPDSMGQLVSDSTLGFVWVTDETNGGDVIQNLNLTVADPASQPYVTSVGGTSLGHGSPNLPPWTERPGTTGPTTRRGLVGVACRRRSPCRRTNRSLGIVNGSSAIAGGCREVPDVSADADPSSGYIVYDSVNGLDWTALGGTSGAAPLWAAVLAVVASANGNTSGYGLLNPALYQLAQRSPNTYLTDVTSGNNDYNATADGQYPALSGYDMATGLGTPVASELAAGLAVPVDVAVSGSQTYGGSPDFQRVPEFRRPGRPALGCDVGRQWPQLRHRQPVDADQWQSGGRWVHAGVLVRGAESSGPNAGGYSLAYTTTGTISP